MMFSANRRRILAPASTVRRCLESVRVGKKTRKSTAGRTQRHELSLKLLTVKYYTVTIFHVQSCPWVQLFRLNPTQPIQDRKVGPTTHPTLTRGLTQPMDKYVLVNQAKPVTPKRRWGYPGRCIRCDGHSSTPVLCNAER